MTRQYDVIIVGGGIAGLTVAWQLRRERPDLATVVLEATGRPGGRIQTEILDHPAGEFVIDLGPDSILTTKPWAHELCVELGLGDQLIPIEQSTHPTAIWHAGRPVDLPTGLSPLRPLDPEAVLTSGLLSREGALRALQEQPDRPAQESDDESLGSFIRRRFGPEYLEAIVEPLLAGIYNADPEELGLRASFPQLLDLDGPSPPSAADGGHRQAAQAVSPFVSLRRGMQQLSDAVAAELGSILRTHARVQRIELADSGEYRMALATGEHLSAPALVLAAPLSTVRALLPPSLATAHRLLGNLKTAASGAIVLAWPDHQIGCPLRGYGLVVPKREHQPFNAVTVMSRKYTGRAPRGWTLLRFFFGGFRSPRSLLMDDAALIQAARDFAAISMGIAGPPAFTRIARWNEGSLIYQVGHKNSMAELDASLPAGLFLTGAHFCGPGIPDAVRSSANLAREIATTSISNAARLV